MAIKAGAYYTLPIDRIKEPGAYLKAEDIDILLPKRFLPATADVGDNIKVFVYHDNEGRFIATTEFPKGAVGDIVSLRVRDVTKIGAFLDWGIMKDIFLPLSQMRDRVHVGSHYFVKIYRDELTGRVACTQKFESSLGNDVLVVEEGETLPMLVYRRTNIGYEVILKSQNTGVLHFDDAFLPVKIGDQLTGFVKKIREDHTIDVQIGQKGYAKVDAQSEVILSLLKENGGYLPYNDKTDPEEIYRVFNMSKKTFKMTIGKLLKEGKISFTKNGFEEVGA